jgi:hypothetical protein
MTSFTGLHDRRPGKFVLESGLDSPGPKQRIRQFSFDNYTIVYRSST